MGAPAKKGHELLDELLGVQRQKSLWIPGHYHPIAERYRASNQRHRTDTAARYPHGGGNHCDPMACPGQRNDRMRRRAFHKRAMDANLC